MLYLLNYRILNLTLPVGTLTGMDSVQLWFFSLTTLSIRDDPQRAAWQKSKLASKDSSAASHLQLLGLRSNSDDNIPQLGVYHLDLS